VKKNTNQWTKESIKEILKTNNVAVLRGLLCIYHLQTDDEKMVEDVRYRNNIGFSGCDAYIMSRFATFFMKNGYLTIKQLELTKKKIMKYAGQLAKIANGEIFDSYRPKIIITKSFLQRLKSLVIN